MSDISRTSRTLLELSAEEARDFFFRQESYCSFDIPYYFDFSGVLAKSRSIVEGNATFKPECKVENSKPIKAGDLDGVNYEILNNKDGAYGWRPFQLVNPVLYTYLISKITDDNSWAFIRERFSEFQANEKIVCKSIPLAVEDTTDRSLAISNWWKEVEQESVRLSLEYRYMATTDIVDCYGALYTHSVAWALHGRDLAKKNRKDSSLIGNSIDKTLQDMHNGQTNGIPQGNALSDFIAEMVLGYADIELMSELDHSGVTDFKIIRYRDDYRIFTSSEQDARSILLALTRVLSSLNFKLNATKTSVSTDIISKALKPDKIYWNSSVQHRGNLFKQLLVIRELADRFPNSGSLVKALTSFRRRIEKMLKRPDDNPSLIAIIVDIMYKNPRVYPQAASILSKLLSLEDSPIAIDYLDKISARFSDVPNTGLLDIWLQRFSWRDDPSREFEEPLCAIVSEKNTNSIWNLDWLAPESRSAVLEESIIDRERLSSAGPVISVEETETFASMYGSYE